MEVVDTVKPVSRMTKVWELLEMEVDMRFIVFFFYRFKNLYNVRLVLYSLSNALQIFPSVSFAF